MLHCFDATLFAGGGGTANEDTTLSTFDRQMIAEQDPRGMRR